MDDKTQQVTDQDIQAIIDQAEAGVNDMVAVYEPIERSYFATVTSSVSTVTYAIDTNAR